MLWVLVSTIVLTQLATQSGWWTAEFGRQPWVVWQLLRTDGRRVAAREHVGGRVLDRYVRGALRTAARAVPVPAGPEDPGRAPRIRRRTRTPSRSRTPSGRSSRGVRGCRADHEHASSAPVRPAPSTPEGAHHVAEHHLVRAVRGDHRWLRRPRRLRHGCRHALAVPGARATARNGSCSTASDRSGTATRCGSCWAEALCSRRSRSSTRPCSPVSTWR